MLGSLLSVFSISVKSRRDLRSFRNARLAYRRPWWPASTIGQRISMESASTDRATVMRRTSQTAAKDLDDWTLGGRPVSGGVEDERWSNKCLLNGR